MVPKEPSAFGRLAARLVYVLVIGLDKTIRYRWTVHPTAAEAVKSGPVIFAIWHNRLALSVMLYKRACKAFRTAGRWTTTRPQMAAIVSASRDGGVLAAVLERLGVQPVRGSTSRRGSQAMLELTTWAERGYDLAVTPDGPRGPREVVQEGVIALAQLTGFPIVPVSYTLGWKYTLHSWDRFQIPLPFARCNVMLDEVLRLPQSPASGAAEREAARLELERRLRAIS